MRPLLLLLAALSASAGAQYQPAQNQQQSPYTQMLANPQNAQALAQLLGAEDAQKATQTLNLVSQVTTALAAGLQGQNGQPNQARQLQQLPPQPTQSNRAQPRGGFQAEDATAPARGGRCDCGNSNSLTRATVREAKLLPDNRKVLLEGYILGSAETVNPEEYIFTDNQDTIKVEIENDVWRGQTVKPSTKIRIQGEVDVNPLTRTTEIEVYRLDLLK